MGPVTAASLSTTFSAGNNHRGNMFDVVANQPIVITRFDVSPMGTTPYEVYYREGTWVGNATSAAGWTLIQTGTLSYTGAPVPIVLSTPLSLKSNQTYGIYITSASQGVSLNYTDGTAVGNVYASDAVLSISEGGGMEYAFTNGTGAIFQPRVWNGTIYYEVVGPVTQLEINAPGSAQEAAPFTLNVRALDANGYVNSNYSGTVHFTSSDPLAQLPADAGLTGGNKSFSTTLHTPGMQTITVSDLSFPAIKATSGAIQVAALPLPVLVDDTRTASRTSATLLDVLANDESGLTLDTTFPLVLSSASAGNLAYLGGQIQFSPSGSFNAPVSFQYRACNALNKCAVATVTLTPQAAAVATAVPTLNEWGLIATVLALGMFGAVRLRSR